MRLPTVPERLNRNRFVLDDEQSHIEVHQEALARSGFADALVACCPARVYAKQADGSISVEYAACLECGTCLAVVPEGTLSWHYPRGGFGVQFREG